MLDRSGSMYGIPMQEAKKALIIALQRLTFQDRFAICAFDDRAEWFGSYEGNVHCCIILISIIYCNRSRVAACF